MTYTPWGPSQSSHRHAVGIVEYSCAGHGGFHLSPTRQAAMPDALRLDSPWYEEDCDWALIVVAFPDLFSTDMVEHARRAVKDWHPDRWTAFTGETLTGADSFVMAQREFREANAANWVAISAWGSWHDNVPAGKVGVLAKLAGDRHPGPERWFLVPGAEYDAREFGFVVDLDRHEETGPYFVAMVGA